MFYLKNTHRFFLQVLLFFSGLSALQAATITVTNGSDSGSGSLRNAVSTAASGDLINFAANVSTVSLTSGEIAVDKSLTIDGGTSGVTVTRVSGNFRLFNVSSGTLSFIRINLTNGNTTTPSGGSAVAGTSAVTLIFNGCNITGNNATGEGAAIVASGPTTFINCRIANNTTTNTVGHAILLYPPGALNMTGCTVSGNIGGSGGGAIDIRGGGGGSTTVNLTNCTISGNQQSGIILPNNECTANFVNTTITNNGIGISSFTNKCSIKNCIVAENIGADISNTGSAFISSTYNIVGTPGSSGLVNGVGNNQVGVTDAKLLALASNGGATQTHALSPCSPAINAGTSSGAPSTDQRGSSRFGAVDIGSYELQSSPTSITLNTVPSPPTCNGLSNGSIAVSILGGTSPYTYAWSGTGTGTNPRTNLAAGTYTVTVTDNGGCSGTRSETLSAPAVITINTSVANVLCNGGNSGEIDLTVSGGTSPYSYAWTGSGTGTNPRTNLSAGTYTVTVTDNNGCTRTNISTVTQPSAITVTPTPTNATCGTSNGSISLAVSGGTSPYTFAWTGTGTGDNPRTGLAAGTYTVTVTDNLGCSRTSSATVSSVDNTPPSITCPANTTVAANSNCIATLASYTGSTTASDNCGGSPTITQTPAAGTTLSLGATTVTMRATDATGNSSTCSFSVTVTDQTPPSISNCPANTTVSADVNGNYAMPVVTTIPTVLDNCSANPTRTQTPAAGAILTVGTSVVSIQATDAAGNSSTCSYSLTINPGCATPTLTCPANTTVAASANCTASLPSYISQTTVTGGCGTTTVTQSPTAGTTLSLGTHVVTMTVTDANNSTATCTFTVTVADQTPPNFACPANTTVAAGANCTATLANYAASVTASDNCSANPTETQSPAAGTTFTGSQVVTLTATDAAGNSSTCSFLVTVTDQTPPSFACPANTTVTTGANCTAILADYVVTASDNCSANPNETQSPAAGTSITGTQTIILTATDAAGNSSTCSFTVTVADQTPPSFACPANTTVAVGGVNCNATLANYAASVSATDNCTANPTETQSPVAGTTISGVQVVTLTATDAAGNSSTCSFNVTAIDQTAPTVTCQPFVTTLGANGTVTVTTANVFQSGSDNCGTVNQVSVTPSTLTCANIGLTTVVLTVSDNSGNTATCSAIVKMSDNLAPTVVCKNFTTSLNATGTVTITPANVYQSGTDNCGTVAPISVTPATFNCSNIGNNVVTLIAIDGSGNQATCSAIVTVTDPIAPVALCKNATVSIPNTGSASVTPTMINNGTTDNCSFTLAVSPATFTCAQLGLNTVVLTATDASGNTATCSATVTVRDLTGPVAICKNATIFLNATGEATLDPSQVDNGSFDACGIASMTVSDNLFNCSDIGTPIAVFLRVRDINGNMSTCTSYVTVRDNTAPTASCQDVQVTLGANGKVAVYGASLAAASTDNCGVWSYTPIAKVYTTANIGVNYLTITVKDWSGNAATCVSEVTVFPNDNLGGNGNGTQSVNDEEEDLDSEILESEITEELTIEIDSDISMALDNTKIEVLIYPNPTMHDAFVEFELPYKSDYRVVLMDATGRLAYASNGYGAEGFNRLVLPMSELPSGVYFMELRAGTLVTRKQLIRQE